MGKLMDRINEEFRSAKERREAFSDRARKGMTLSADTVERFAGYQLALATDLVDGSVAQVKLLGQAEGISDYFSQQVDMASQAVQSTRGRVTELSNLVKESVTDFSALSQSANDKPAASKPAAKKKATAKARKAA